MSKWRDDLPRRGRPQEYKSLTDRQFHLNDLYDTLGYPLNLLVAIAIQAVYDCRSKDTVLRKEALASLKHGVCKSIIKYAFPELKRQLV